MRAATMTSAPPNGATASTTCSLAFGKTQSSLPLFQSCGRIFVAPFASICPTLGEASAQNTVFSLAFGKMPIALVSCRSL